MEARSTTAAATAPNRADCHRAKGVPKAAHRKWPQTWAETSTLSNAVQRPTPTPTGTDATKSARVNGRLIQ
jgi:hypothetical protein